MGPNRARNCTTPVVLSVIISNTFPIDCHVMFGQKLELVVDRRKNYLFVPLPPPRLPSVIIDLTVDDFDY